MLLGTCVKITTDIITPAGATITAVKISIADAAGTKQTDAASMSLDAVTGEYYYLFQSTSVMVAGEFKVVVTATAGSYAAVSELTFVLDTPEFPAAPVVP